MRTIADTRNSSTTNSTSFRATAQDWRLKRQLHRVRWPYFSKCRCRGTAPYPVWCARNATTKNNRSKNLFLKNQAECTRYTDTLVLSNCGSSRALGNLLGLVEEFQNMKDSQGQSDNAGCNQKQVSGSNCAHQASRYRAAQNSAQSAAGGNNAKESLALLESHTSLACIQKGGHALDRENIEPDPESA